jgi:hypothetical protein
MLNSCQKLSNILERKFAALRKAFDKVTILERSIAVPQGSIWGHYFLYYTEITSLSVLS